MKICVYSNHDAKNVFDNMFQTTYYKMWKNIIVFGTCMYFPKKVVTFWHVQLMEVNREMKKIESEERRDKKEKGEK